MKVELWHIEKGEKEFTVFAASVGGRLKLSPGKFPCSKQIFLVESLVMHNAFLTCVVRPAVTQERYWPVYRADRSSVCHFAPPIESRVIFH